MEPRPARSKAPSKNELGAAGTELVLWLWLECDGHQPAPAHEEELTSVTRPPGLLATLVGDLPHRTGARIRAHIDFTPPRNVGRVGDMPASGLAIGATGASEAALRTVVVDEEPGRDYLHSVHTFFRVVFRVARHQRDGIVGSFDVGCHRDFQEWLVISIR